MSRNQDRQNFLYALSAGTFSYPGTSRDPELVGPEALARNLSLVNSASPRPHEDGWVVSAFRSVDPGDLVWIYFGWRHGMLGVVAVGEIEDVIPRPDEPGKADISFNYLLTPTRRLQATPVPATEVRSHGLPQTFANALHIDRYGGLVKRLHQAAGLK